jgi:hypothetical protein
MLHELHEEEEEHGEGGGKERGARGGHAETELNGEQQGQLQLEGHKRQELGGSGGKEKTQSAGLSTGMDFPFFDERPWLAPEVPVDFLGWGSSGGDPLLGGGSM